MWHGQHQEDRKLVELLGEKDSGFYIDLGAWEPTTDSVTKRFYDRGWRGINVEPVPHYHAWLERERPRDINLRVAVGERVGLATMIVMNGTGLSTFVQQNADRQTHPKEELIVPVTTLGAICRAFVPRHVTIDFLKIDVEGSEREAIAGADWEAYRPTILVIEAIEPGTGAPQWDDWEPTIIAVGYDFLEFDGVNRWYRIRR